MPVDLTIECYALGSCRIGYVGEFLGLGALPVLYGLGI